VADAEICLFGQEPGPVKINGGWKTDASQKSRTDFSGSFTLPLDKPGPYRVEARKPGYSAPTAGGPNYREVTLPAESPVAEVKMYLAQPGRITGLVVDEETRRRSKSAPTACGTSRWKSPNCGDLHRCQPHSYHR
jgi:hypothetical protein